MLIVAPGVTQACKDKEQVLPMLDRIEAFPVSLGQAANILKDTRCSSARNVEACETRDIAPFIAVRRDEHHPSPR